MKGCARSCFLLLLGWGVGAYAFYSYFVSRQRGGLIPHPNWSKLTRLVRGDASKVAEQLRSRMVGYFVGVVIFSGLAYAIVVFYRSRVAALPS
jgi:hypothetical protein